MVGWLFVTMLKKPQNCPISDSFNLTPQSFCPYCLILTLYSHLLTTYHKVPTRTGLYRPSTIISYQPVPTYTDPVAQLTPRLVDLFESARSLNSCNDSKKYMVVEIINDLTMLLLQVIIQQLFSVIALRFDNNFFAEIKGYAMLQFSYMMLKIYGKVPYQPIASLPSNVF